MKSNAFTLLEMLVVIGIIAILAALSTTSYSTAMKKSRDSRRLSDLTDMQNAMEQYYTSCGYAYPSDPLGDGIICPTGPVNILPTVPKDPLNSGSYVYSCSGCTTAVYKFCAKLEGGVAPTTCVSQRQ